MSMNVTPMLESTTATITNSDGSTKPALEKQKSSYGFGLTAGIPGGTTHIREHIALDGTAATFDWSATPIQAVRITVTGDTAGTAELDASVAICIDPPNSTVRDVWLTEGTSLATDTYRIMIPQNSTLELYFTSPVDYIGLKRDDGTETLRVNAVGVAA